MIEISILEVGYLRIEVSQRGECGNESHIGKMTILKLVYKLECMISQPNFRHIVIKFHLNIMTHQCMSLQNKYLPAQMKSLVINQLTRKHMIQTFRYFLILLTHHSYPTISLESVLNPRSDR